LALINDVHFSTAQDSTIRVSLNDSTVSEPFGWEIQSTYQVTNDNQLDKQPCMIQDGSGRFITFFTSFSVGGYNIRSSVSNDGITWSTPATITSNQDCLHPSAIEDRNGIYWLSWYEDGSGIWITSSRDGLIWDTPKQITSYDKTAYSWCRNPSLIQDKDGKYWLAYESSIHRSDILVRSSRDGITWDTPIQITPGTEVESNPCLMQDSLGTYWITWGRSEGGTMWISSSKNGEKWNQPRQIETGMTAFSPKLIQDSNGNYVIICSDSATARQGKVWITSSQDCVNWQSPQQLIVGTDFCYLMQDINGKYRVTFTADNQGNDDIWSMTLSQGIVSPLWPPLPEGGLSVRYTNVTITLRLPGLRAT
jgi:hypothetical protein